MSENKKYLPDVVAGAAERDRTGKLIDKHYLKDTDRDDFEQVANKVSSISESDKDNTTKYPNVKAVYDSVSEVREIAEGAQVAKKFNTYEEMIESLNSESKDKYKVGQNFYVVTDDVPDLWVSEVEDSPEEYTYISDEEFVNKLRQDRQVQVGYYKLAKLETGKVNLEDYVEKEKVPGTDRYRVLSDNNLTDQYLEDIDRVISLSASSLFDEDSDLRYIEDLSEGTYRATKDGSIKFKTNATTQYYVYYQNTDSLIKRNYDTEIPILEAPEDIEDPVWVVVNSNLSLSEDKKSLILPSDWVGGIVGYGDKFEKHYVLDHEYIICIPRNEAHQLWTDSHLVSPPRDDNLAVYLFNSPRVYHQSGEINSESMKAISNIRNGTVTFKTTVTNHRDSLAESDPIEFKDPTRSIRYTTKAIGSYESARSLQTSDRLPREYSTVVSIMTTTGKTVTSQQVVKYYAGSTSYEINIRTGDTIVVSTEVKSKFLTVRKILVNHKLYVFNTYSRPGLESDESRQVRMIDLASDDVVNDVYVNGRSVIVTDINKKIASITMIEDIKVNGESVVTTSEDGNHKVADITVVSDTTLDGESVVDSTDNIAKLETASDQDVLDLLSEMNMISPIGDNDNIPFGESAELIYIF